MKNKIWKNYINKKSKENKNKINRRNLYIFPNFKGFQIASLIFFCFAVSIFYQNNFGLLLSIILFFIYFISIIISYQNLLNINLNVVDKLLPAQQNVKINYLIKCKEKRERLNINFDIGKTSINSDINIQRKIKLNFVFDKRGIQEVPNLNVRSEFPFGIINTFSKIFFKEKITIYPKPIKPSDDLLESLFDDKLNEGFDYDFDRIEEAKDISNLSKVSWKHFSIKKKYYVKKFKFSNNANYIVIDLEKIKAESYEKKLSYASYLIEYFYKLKKPFSLKNNDYKSITSCSYEHRNNQLIYLANA